MGVKTTKTSESGLRRRPLQVSGVKAVVAGNPPAPLLLAKSGHLLPRSEDLSWPQIADRKCPSNVFGWDVLVEPERVGRVEL